MDSIESDEGVSSLTLDDITTVRRQLAESQSLIRESVERLRQSQEESEMITRRRDEVESRLAALESEYEELLGTLSILASFSPLTLWDLYIAEKTINEEETSNVDAAESMVELKVPSIY